MSTMTEEPRDDAPVALTVRQDAELVSMPRCTRCQLKYLPARSTWRGRVRIQLQIESLWRL